MVHISIQLERHVQTSIENPILVLKFGKRPAISEIGLGSVYQLILFT